ncbi:MAG: hypothetical protein R3B41_01140 [Candidatus Doudnabacteria bacterium]
MKILLVILVIIIGLLGWLIFSSRKNSPSTSAPTQEQINQDLENIINGQGDIPTEDQTPQTNG